MFKVRKVLSLTIASMMIISILSSCKNEDAGGTTSAIPNSNSVHSVSATPLQLTIFLHYWGTYVFKDDWIVYKKAAEMTNVSLKSIGPSLQSNSEQAFSIMMASNELGDIVHNFKTGFNKYIKTGAFLPLDDLIEKNAPNIKKYLSEHPEVKKSAMFSDDKMYFIPMLFDSKVAEGYFIRKDWLDKLNLSEPKNLNEFYNVLQAFKTQDANGNGKNDEIPYFARGGVSSLYQLFGLRRDWQVINGKVCYTPYMPEYKTAMVNLAKWYKEGLIDKEIFTRGQNARDILLGDNMGGVTHDWFTSTSQFNDKLKDKIPGFEFIPINPPADINGKVWEDIGRQSVTDMGWGISSQNKHPDETMKYFDFWFSEEGLRLNNYGVEGVHYTMVDGMPKFKNEILNGKEPVTRLLWNDGAALNIGTRSLIEAEKQYMNPIAKQGIEMYKDITLDTFPSLPFNEQEEKIIREKYNAILTYSNEIASKWVLGGEPVEPNFEKHIATLKSMGMDDILKAYNDAYQRYIK